MPVFIGLQANSINVCTCRSTAGGEQNINTLRPDACRSIPFAEGHGNTLALNKARAVCSDTIAYCRNHAEYPNYAWLKRAGYFSLAFVIVFRRANDANVKVGIVRMRPGLGIAEIAFQRPLKPPPRPGIRCLPGSRRLNVLRRSQLLPGRKGRNTRSERGQDDQHHDRRDRPKPPLIHCHGTLLTCAPEVKATLSLLSSS